MKLPFGLLTPSELAEGWQRVARDWYVLGEPERAAWCEAWAAYWRAPLWRHMLWLEPPAPSRKAPPLLAGPRGEGA